MNKTNTTSRYRFLYFLLGIGLAAWIFLYLCNPLTVFGGDLGRHLKEGELLINEFNIITTNYFSYNYPNEPVSNHHWLGCGWFYLGYWWGGFEGTNIHFILITFVPTIFLIFWALRQCTHSWAVLGILLILPMLSFQTPGDTMTFSVGFSILYIVLLLRVLQGEIPTNRLWFLSIVQLIWANTHIYYGLGWWLILAALIQTLANSEQREQTKTLAKLLIICILVSCCNPQHIYSLATPFQILSGTFRFLSSNLQSAWQVYKSNHSYEALYVMVLSVFSFVGALWAWRKKNIGIFVAIVVLGFSWWGVWYIKNSALVAIAAFLVWLNLGHEQENRSFWLSYRSPAMFFYILIPLFWATELRHPWRFEFGLGHRPHEFISLDFYKKTTIKGAIFNNYDIGGYLIWGLFPQQRVYIVNRPDAQPAAFYNNGYFPALSNDQQWLQTKNAHNFNIIHFKLSGESKDNLKFLGARLGDGEWGMVYYRKDLEAILIRRNAENQDLLQRYEILPENIQ